MSNEEKYVAAAYLVVFAFVLVYLVIMALKLARLEREVGELTELARQAGRMAEYLFWLALPRVRRARRSRMPGTRGVPGSAGRLATWGVRIGWLLQTALLVVRPHAQTGSRGRPGPAR